MTTLKLVSDPRTLVDSVESSIYEYIKENNLKPGDKLPSENELSEKMGVGRNVVREALSSMKSFGILESRKKRGIVLKTMDVSKNLDKLFYPTMLDKETVVNLLELRLWLEEAIIPTLFKRITDKDIERLNDVLASEIKLKDGRVDITSEIDFHSTIYSVTGNQTLMEIQNVLIPVYRYVNENFDEFQSYKEKEHSTHVSHRDIFEALKAKDKNLYKKEIDMHLVAYQRYIDSFRKKG
jgi:DNA-binding FadR family transcriptional regulator